MNKLEVLATLWPEMTHYEHFARDSRLDAIRLNTAMADSKTLPKLLDQALEMGSGKPLYFDVKGKQLRVDAVSPRTDYCELLINHPITVDTPTPVMFKAGVDAALLEKVEDGRRLIFRGGPHYSLLPGESLQIRHPSLEVHGDLFTEKQLEFIDIAKKAGIDKYMLSYVGSQKEMNEFRRVVGKDAEIIAKIETEKGLDYAVNDFVKNDKNGLLTARGDLFVEVERPHQITTAVKKIVRADPDAILGSRILLSVTDQDVPSCADISDINWLMEVGYRRFMFCDGLCLQKEPLDRAINVLYAVHEEYLKNVEYSNFSARPTISKKGFLKSIFSP